MRTYIRTTVTLDTVLRIPYRNIYCDTALLICSSTGRCRTIYIILECGYRKAVSFLSVYLALDIVYKINNIFSSVFCNRYSQTFICCVLPAFRNVHFYNLLSAGVDRVVVHLYDRIALSSVCSLSRCLHQIDCLLLRNDACKFKEC